MCVQYGCQVSLCVPFLNVATGLASFDILFFYVTRVICQPIVTINHITKVTDVLLDQYYVNWFPYSHN